MKEEEKKKISNKIKRMKENFVWKSSCIYRVLYITDVYIYI